jgi:rubrerythrin
MGFKEIGPMGLPSRLRGTVSPRGTAIAHTNTTLNLRSPGQEAATMGLPLFLAALNLEREGFNLFTELSKETQDESGRKMFLSLAQQERDHIALIEQEIEKRRARDERLPPDTTARAEEFRSRLLGAMEEVKKQSRAAVGKDTDQIRALEVAAKMEDFLCGFYADAISQTESQYSKEFFLHMLEMEREHCGLLEDSLARLETPRPVNAS